MYFQGIDRIAFIPEHDRRATIGDLFQGSLPVFAPLAKASVTNPGRIHACGEGRVKDRYRIITI
jgi:hypothetical protein